MKQVGRLYNRSKDLLFVPALNSYWRRQLQGRVICLLYHRVDSPTNNQFLSQGGSPVIPPEDLQEELSFLKTQGARFLTFRDLRNGLFPASSEFGVIVSFDDCFLDNYAYGLEVLENLGIKAVFFQTTAMLEPKELIWEHTLYWWNRNRQMSESFTKVARRILSSVQGVTSRSGVDLMNFLREKVDLPIVERFISLARAELFENDEEREVVSQIYPKKAHILKAYQQGHEVGSHGHVHAKRLNIDAERFDAELARSVSEIKRLLGHEPKVFSYPFNSYKEGDERICSRYFEQVATVDKDCIRPDSDPMWLPRFTWPGLSRYMLRRRRWLLTGAI